MSIEVAIIAPLISLIIFFLGFYFNKLKEKSSSNKDLNRTYLNGLRLYLEESYFRLHEIQETLKKEKHCAPLHEDIIDGKEIFDKDQSWFVNHGCYLISTSYFVSCLFANIEKLRQQYPYIKHKR
ncbi:MAG: hypothetical protein WCF67_07520, partial [Chitinophagaceae bacterium]